MDAKAQNWDDLRYFLAVAKTGSLSGAARRLGVNHSTVFRRIGAFETQLGVRLFERLPSGYLLTQAGEEMRDGTARVEEEIASLSRKVTGQDLRLSGTVRVTTLDMLAFGLLPRHLVKFRTVYPGIEVELIVGNATLNLNQREADIALRVGNAPPDTLVGRRVGRLVFAIYGSETYRSDKPGIGLEAHDWIGFDTEHAALTRRFNAFLPAAQPLLRTNSIAAAIAATKAGMGLAILTLWACRSRTRSRACCRAAGRLHARSVASDP